MGGNRAVLTYLKHDAGMIMMMLLCGVVVLIRHVLFEQVHVLLYELFQYGDVHTKRLLCGDGDDG